MATPNTGIPYVPENTADPAAGLNLSLNVIDALLQSAVIDMGLTAPPASPSDGDMHIVGASATGEWEGQDNSLARYVAEGDFWQFYAAGVNVHMILNLDEGSALYVWDGSAWVAPVAPGSVSASAVSYDNTASGLSATDAQDAIDEVAASAGGIPDAPADGELYGRKDGDWEQVPGSGEGEPPVVTLPGDTYDMGDLTPGAWHVFTSATAVTITVEDDSVEPVPADAEYGLECRGSGGVALVEGSAATIIPPKGGTVSLEQSDFAVLKRTDEDEYKLVGSTVAA